MKGYYNIKDPFEFLAFYQRIYNEQDYKKCKSQKIIDLFPRLEGKRVLDVGCGGGFYSLAAMKKGASEIILLDISSVCVKAAKLNIFQSNPAWNAVEGVIADAQHLPLRDESIDFILCIDLIEHLLADKQFLLDAWRALSKHGYMLVSTQNSRSINYLLEALVQRIMFKNRGWMGWDPTHLRFYTSKSLIWLIKSYNFEIIKMTGTYYIPYLMFQSRFFFGILYRSFKELNKKLEKSKNFVRYFGWGIICLCSKKA